jgi:hypothetical protein
MLLPLEGCVVVNHVNFIARGAQKRIINVDMLRKQNLVLSYLRSMPRNEDVVQWIVSP